MTATAARCWWSEATSLSSFIAAVRSRSIPTLTRTRSPCRHARVRVRCRRRSLIAFVLSENTTTTQERISAHMRYLRPPSAQRQICRLGVLELLAIEHDGHCNAEQAKCHSCRSYSDCSRHATALRYRENDAQPADEEPASDGEPECCAQRPHALSLLLASRT